MTCISILIPTLNEEAFVERCLDSVLAFEVPRGLSTEIIVLDGGSTDGTRQILEKVAAADGRVRVVENPRRLQSAALNLGVSLARGDYIMRLDAHSLYPSDYLATCWETACRTGADNVGGVTVIASDSETYSEAVVQALTTHRFGTGGAAYRGRGWEGPADTVPYGFFRGEVFNRFGLYDERLERAQDYELNRRIALHGGRIWLNPAIRIFYYPQAKFGGFLLKQLLREGPFNAYMWYVAPYAFAPRHAVTGIFVAVLAALAALGLFAPAAWWVLAGALAIYGGLALASAVAQSRRYREWRHLICLPFAFFLYHAAHGIGIVGGLFRLATRTAPVQGRRPVAQASRTLEVWES